MIQIPAFLEILISCFLRSNEVGFSWWAGRPGGAPRNRSPSGWRTEGKLTGLVEGMPDVSPTWSPGRTDFAKGRTQRPGISGRMKRCSRRWCVIPGCHRANSRTSKPGDRGSHLSRRSGLPPVFLQLVADRFAAVARKAKRQEWECLLGRSNCLDPVYRKNGFPFPPGRSLGVSFFLGPTPRSGRNKPVADRSRPTSCRACASARRTARCHRRWTGRGGRAGSGRKSTGDR